MLRARIPTLACLFAVICLLLAGPALASTKCQCNNGAIVNSMDDDADACDDACDGMGGGSVWRPDNAGDGDDSDVTVDDDRQERREQRRESIGR